MTTESIDAVGDVHSVLAVGPTPAAPSAFSTVLTIAWRTMLKIKHVPFQLFDVVVTPIMFTLLFTYIFGGALAGTPREYIQYLLPGILVQTIVFITVYTGVGLNTDIQKGLYDRFRSLPMWQPSPLLGALLGDVFRYSLAGAIIILVGFIIGFRPAGGFMGLVWSMLLILVFSFALSWLWIIVGMLMKTPETVMTVSFVFLMPLTFASDIFVRLETMPGWLQAVVGRNPVTLLARATRGLIHGNVVMWDIWWVLISSAVITAIAVPIAMRLYYRER
ncbi:MAG TPA: ABC transporter permease [Gemmatimonadaceae bacterium]|nr:ABC transporter permease [Gemmatimonadaceae bacterium]